uniref:Uncharacterized protein n=1 Tax=Anopheles minimus TaxID=112268 RepID=A0A182WNP3_9DIPT
MLSGLVERVRAREYISVDGALKMIFFFKLSAAGGSGRGERNRTLAKKACFFSVNVKNKLCTHQ